VKLAAIDDTVYWCMVIIMKLTFDNEYSIFNQDNVFVAGSGTTFKINGIKLLDDSVILEAIQVWDKEPGLLPKGTTFKLAFENAKLEDVSIELAPRAHSEIKDLDIISNIDITKYGNAPGYTHGIQLYDDAEHTWNLFYDNVEATELSSYRVIHNE